MERYCPICYSTEKKKLYHQKFSKGNTSLIKEYDVVVCEICGMVFADNVPTQKELEIYYSDISRYELDLNEGEVSKEYLLHNLLIFRFIKNYIDKKSTILDIGCSTGTLLKLLKEEGYKNIYGIDPSPSCIKFLKDKYSIKGFVGNLSNLNIKNKIFDFIILSSIIEHLVDMRDLLINLRRHVRPNGLLFIEIPDADKFKDYIYTPFQQFSLEHIEYFNEKAIKQLLKLCGYEIIYLARTENKGNQTIDPCYFIIAYKKNIIEDSEFKVKKDITLEKNIKQYIKKSYKLEKQELKKIKKIFKQYDNLIVWGVGTNTQRILNKIDLSKISYFVDSNINYIGKKVEGKQVKLPKDINSYEPILILSWSYQNEIIHQIKDLKLNNKVITIYE